MLNKIIKNILKIFKNFYYFLYTPMKLYDTYHALDILVVYLENVKIINIEIIIGNCVITFSDNSVLTFWNSRWNAWMAYGTMKFSNGRIMKWYKKQPSCEVYYKYKKLILNHEKSKNHEIDNVEIEDFSDCLPIKLLRKQKLKNIKK